MSDQGSSDCSCSCYSQFPAVCAIFCSMVQQATHTAGCWGWSALLHSKYAKWVSLRVPECSIVTSPPFFVPFSFVLPQFLVLLYHHCISVLNLCRHYLPDMVHLCTCAPVYSVWSPPTPHPQQSFQSLSPVMA
jgi:hypothetical protein